MPAGELSHDKPRHLHPPRLDILRVDPGVADQGEGLDKDLPAIGRIGQRLLIACHGGIEHHLGLDHQPPADRPEAPPMEETPISKYEPTCCPRGSGSCAR